MRLLRIGLINLAVFSGIIASIEISLNVAHLAKRRIASLTPISSGEVQDGKPIPTSWEQVFHPGVGHSHQKSEFNKNVNTSNLTFDNISVTEVFKGQKESDSKFSILILGGSTTDPLGTHFSGYRGTWVHHLFEGITQSNSSHYIVDNAGNGGSTSSNELLRLITKSHSNQYDLAISFNGINEIYFAIKPYLRNKENVLSSSMLLEAMGDWGIIKGLDGKTYSASLKSSLINSLRESRTNFHLNNIRKSFNKKMVAAKSKDFTSLSQDDKDLLNYSANVWAKNTDLMNSVSLTMNSKYLAVLQPALGVGGNHCPDLSEKCMFIEPRYIAQMNYLYSILRRYCSVRDYCINISSDRDLTTDSSLYTDPRHPNSNGNKRIAGLIKERVIQALSD